jgi:hypothetical protein
MSRLTCSSRTRNALGAVVLCLAIVAAALVLPQAARRAADDRLAAWAADLAARAAQADAAGLLLRRSPEQFAGELSPGLLSVLHQEKERFEGLVQTGELALSVIEAGEAERRDVDVGDGRALYRVPLLVEITAHPTKAPGRYRGHTTILLLRQDDGWQVSQLHTLLDEEVLP